VAATHNELFDELTYDNASAVAMKIMDQFARKQYDKVDLVYNQFKNAAMQRVVCEPFLPVVSQRGEAEQKKSKTDYIFEPSIEYIVQELIPRSLKVQFFKALLDSFAAEHGARMTAMHKATDNATGLIKELKLHYNKARQATITKEILEIVGGAEALKG
jgi:F-type H+-transporting ATPase subunit gamma